MIQGQYGVHLQFLREDDATSGTHGQDNISEIHGDNQKHPQLHRNERTQQMGKNIKKYKDDCQAHHIPTILNGKIEEKNTGVTLNEVNDKNGKNKTQTLKQRKVIMIGDSFLRGTRDNVELLTSDRFGIFSLLQPGCDLDTILQSAYKASKNLTHKDLICLWWGK